MFAVVTHLASVITCVFATNCSSSSISLTLRVWELNAQARKIVPTDCNLGQLKRIVNCIQVSEDDQYMYCGTTSGDVLQVGHTAGVEGWTVVSTFLLLLPPGEH